MTRHLHPRTRIDNVVGSTTPPIEKASSNERRPR
jgi:hypothetical protein